MYKKYTCSEPLPSVKKKSVHIKIFSKPNIAIQMKKCQKVESVQELSFLPQTPTPLLKLYVCTPVKMLTFLDEAKT